MENNISASEMPLCLNVIRLQSYLLLPDEVMLFDWFVVKQIAFKYKDFHYSQARIEKETRIKRTRQDVIIKRFCELGFLTTEVRKNTMTSGRVRYFSIDFVALAKPNVLNRIVDEDHPAFDSFRRFMSKHATTKKQNTSKKKEIAYNQEVADSIYNLLNDVYDQRRRKYNKGELTKKKPKASKEPMQLQRSWDICFSVFQC